MLPLLYPDMLNLAMVIEHWARTFPARAAVVLGDTRLTYAQLDALASQVANGLIARGIAPGDKVALSCPNLPYFPIAYYGILKAGAVVVPLNVLLKAPEVAYHLQDSDAKAFLCFEGTPELPMARMGHEGFLQAPGCAHFIVITADPAAPSPIPGAPTFGALVHGQPTTAAADVRQPDDPAILLYTSGTTGHPKGAELTHSSMLLNAAVTRDLHLDFIRPQGNVALAALPLFHSFGQTVSMNAMFYQGATLVMLPRFEPAAVLALMAKERVNFFSGVPTMYWALLNHVRRNQVDTEPVARELRLCISGGSAMPVEVLKAFEEAFGVVILEGYGLSEASPVVTFNQAGLPRKVGSIGRPLMLTQVKVVDDHDQEVPRGQPGEVVVRGHNVMRGYYKRPEETAQALRGGWLHTGDIARMDEEGYLFIVDRIKDLIIRGGYNVYPREVEEVLLEHPAVSMAAVVGVPHEEHGEEVKAFVIREPGAELAEAELIAWAKQRMAAYKYPRLVEFREVLPTNETGKILKRELRLHPA